MRNKLLMIFYQFVFDFLYNGYLLGTFKEIPTRQNPEILANFPVQRRFTNEKGLSNM